MDWVLYWKSTKVKWESVENETDISKLKQGVSFLIWRILTLYVMVQDRNGIVNDEELTSNTFL